MLGNVPIFLTAFLIFLIAYAFRRSQIELRRKKREQEFWDREEQAKHTPAKDLSEIEYITVHIDKLPIGETDEDDILMIEDELLELASKRILDINDKTNTDIKIEYGTANFDIVTEFGENFNRLLTLLCDYAKSLMENEYYDKACDVLEYGVSIGSDISANYTLLGDCYVRLNRPDDLDELKTKVEQSSLLLKDSILNELQE